MTDEQILENYKKYCTKLKSADNLTIQDYHSIKDLEQFIKDGVVDPKDVVKAFKKANKSKFLRGEVNSFQANIKWMTNPTNIDKVNSGKYDDRTKKQRIELHEYDFDEIERKLYLANKKKLKERQEGNSK